MHACAQSLTRLPATTLSPLPAMHAQKQRDPPYTKIKAVSSENGDFNYTIGALNNFWRSAENFYTRPTLKFNKKTTMLWVRYFLYYIRCLLLAAFNVIVDTCYVVLIKIGCVTSSTTPSDLYRQQQSDHYPERP